MILDFMHCFKKTLCETFCFDKMSLHIATFAYKDRPVFSKGTAIIDCRTLANPYKQKNLRSLSGSDPRIKEFIVRHSGEEFCKLLKQAKNFYENGHRKIWFGCFGGKHRSVCVSLAFANEMHLHGIETNI